MSQRCIRYNLINFSQKKKKKRYNLIVRSQIVAQTQVEKGDGPNKPSTINL